MEAQLDQGINRLLLPEEFPLNMRHYERGQSIFDGLNKDTIKEYKRLNRLNKDELIDELADLVVFKNRGPHHPDVIVFVDFHIGKIDKIRE